MPCELLYRDSFNRIGLLVLSSDENIENPVVGNIGLVFGTGFAPFRDGPFRYIDQVGADKYVGMMHDFSGKYGPQFEPCQLLKDCAASGKKFHSL
jgi:hypothetical protein